MYWIRVITVMLCFLALASCNRDGGGVIAPGIRVPDISYETLEGETVRLKDFRGKFVLVNFLASWCAPCKSEMPQLQALHNQMKDRNFIVVGIGIDDDIKALRSFAQDTGVTFPFLVDKEGSSRRFFRFAGFPETVVIDKKGRVLLLPDPESGEPVVKFLGPREWDNEYFLKLFGSLEAAG